MHFYVFNNLAIEQNGLPVVEVYPNPTDGTVVVPSEGVKEVWCVAADGRRTRLEVKDGRVSLKDYPAGVYVLEVQTCEGLFAAKVVRQ